RRRHTRFSRDWSSDVCSSDLDLTAEMLPVAASLAAEKGIANMRFAQADAEGLPFATGCFDLVTCRIAPHHFPDVGQFVREAAREIGRASCRERGEMRRVAGSE